MRHLHTTSKIVAIAVVVFLLGGGIIGCALMEELPGSEKQQTLEAEEAYFKQGVAAFERGDYSDASKHFEKLVDSHTLRFDNRHHSFVDLTKKSYLKPYLEHPWAIALNIK